MDSQPTKMESVALLPSNYKIRIPPDAFVAFLFAFILFVAIPSAFRIFFRLYFHRRLYLDDWFLIFAIACLSPAFALMHSVQDMMKLQLNVSAGRQEPPSDFYSQMATYEKRLQIASALVWSALYAIKFSFLVFFYQFTRTMKGLHLYWWGVVVLCGLCAGVSIPLGFMVCAHYDPGTWLDFCPVSSQLAHERIYLIITTTLDVVTDVGVIVIPALLLWPLQLPWLRKVAVWALMSLSTFMVIIAIVRAAGANLPNGVIDVSWVAFWQGVESAVAVLTVSLLVLKSMLGSDKLRRAHRRQRRDAETGGLTVMSEKATGGLHSDRSVRDGHPSISEPQLTDAWDDTDTFAPPVPPKSATFSRQHLAPPPLVSRPSEAGSIPMVLVIPESSAESEYVVSPPTARSELPAFKLRAAPTAHPLTVLSSLKRSPVSPHTPPQPRQKLRPPPLVIPSFGTPVQPAAIIAQRRRL